MVAASVSAGAPDVYVYQPNADTPLNTYEVATGGTLIDLAARGLAWSADDSTLFAVVQSTVGVTRTTTYTLHQLPSASLTSTVLSLNGPATVQAGGTVSLNGVLSPASGTLPSGTAVTVTPDSTTLSLSGPTRVNVGKSVTLTGKLSTVAGPLSSSAVSITRTASGSTKQVTATTSADGTFTLTDTPPAYGTYTYKAGFLLVNQADLGIPYRIRTDYFRSSSDTRNLNSDSGWLYFEIEK